jgi:protocatechuate 4,5-dioxygenase alpha chain
MDGAHCRHGYNLNMFCMSLNRKSNRESFRADEKEYLGRFPMTAEQRQAVIARDWLGMLRLGGNIYYTFKLAIFDGISMQEVGALMSGVNKAEFQQMMLAGGRTPAVSLNKGG